MGACQMMRAQGGSVIQDHSFSPIRLYGSFNCIIYDHVAVLPEPIRRVDGEEAWGKGLA